MKNTIIALLLFCTIIVIITSCAEPAQQPIETREVDLTVDKNAIAKQGQRFTDALKAGDVNLIGSLYTTDAKILDQNAPSYVGRDAIIKHYADVVQDSITNMKGTSLGMWGDTTMLVDEGTLEVSNTGGKLLDRGKYLVVWKKVDGQWLIFRDMYNSDGQID
jgi:ketosteroid isomerase-like protein